jgi:hypothetical protein
MTTKFRTESFDNPLALCVPDYSSSVPQACRAVLELDARDGAVGISLLQQVECNSVPMAVYRGIVRRYDIPHTTNAAELTAAINNGEFDGLFQNVLEAIRANIVNSYGENEALENAESALGSALAQYDIHAEMAGLWEACDWLPYGDDVVARYGISATTSDAEIEEIAEKIEAEARAEYLAVLMGTVSYLQQLREKLAED